MALSLLSWPAVKNRVPLRLAVTRPAVSRHLRVLKEAALVTARRDGTRQIYALAPEGARMLREYAEMV